LLIGTIPLLIIAGILEGFFSPTSETVFLKFSIAAGLFLLLVLYLGKAGTQRKAAAARV
jgi:sulfite exporter TauE/SafE